MPQVIPGPGESGLPQFWTRVLQYVDAGYSPLNAVTTALTEYVAALAEYLGKSFAADVGKIG